MLRPWRNSPEARKPIAKTFYSYIQLGFYRPTSCANPLCVYGRTNKEALAKISRFAWAESMTTVLHELTYQRLKISERGCIFSFGSGFGIIHLRLNFLFGETMHQLLCVTWQLRPLSRRLWLAYVNLYIISIDHMIYHSPFLLLTTGVSNSYRSLHFLPSDVMTSTSMYSNGLVNFTFDKISFAFMHSEQLARVKRVIRQACCKSRVVGSISGLKHCLIW